MQIEKEKQEKEDKESQASKPLIRSPVVMGKGHMGLPIHPIYRPPYATDNRYPDPRNTEINEDEEDEEAIWERLRSNTAPEQRVSDIGTLGSHQAYEEEEPESEQYEPQQGYAQQQHEQAGVAVEEADEVGARRLAHPHPARSLHPLGG